MDTLQVLADSVQTTSSLDTHILMESIGIVFVLCVALIGTAFVVFAVIDVLHRLNQKGF